MWVDDRQTNFNISNCVTILFQSYSREEEEKHINHVCSNVSCWMVFGCNHFSLQPEQRKSSKTNHKQLTFSALMYYSAVLYPPCPAACCWACGPQPPLRPEPCVSFRRYVDASVFPKRHEAQRGKSLVFARRCKDQRRPWFMQVKTAPPLWAGLMTNEVEWELCCYYSPRYRSFKNRKKATKSNKNDTEA